MKKLGDKVNEGVDPEFLNDFILEARDHLEEIEMKLLNLETEPDNEEIVHGLFRNFHTIKGLAGFVDQYLIQEIAHKTESLLDDCRNGIIGIDKIIIDIILGSTDIIKELCNDIGLSEDKDFMNKVEKQLELLEEGVFSDSRQTKSDSYQQERQPDEKLIGEILVGDKKISPLDVDNILEKQQHDYLNLKFGEIALKEKKIEARDLLEAIRKQKTSPGTVIKENYIRISVDKIDNLVNMMGELIICQSQVEQETTNRFGTNDSFVTNLSNMSRIMKEMQYLTMSLRMVSLNSIFQKLTRIARDTIEDLEKDVFFSTTGEETEIDRNVAERILEPLVHIVKNAISHGIEDRETRNERNKNPQGKVEITAYSKRGSVYIEVTDDGGGINLDKVLKKALDKQFINPSRKYSDEEILDFIFLPGFSTSGEINQISGRGVGMDVVKTEVSRIGGRVEIDNRPGEGCSFILKIPINLAVINGTIIELSGSHYIIPTLNIRQIFKPEDEQWVYIKGRKEMVRVREKIYSLLKINKIFELEKEIDYELVILLEMDNIVQALPVQNIIARREIVVKPLGEEFAELNFVSGVSILGDGRVSLILDIEQLFKLGGVD